MPPVGAWTAAERRVLMVFAATALAWITRQEPLGGWAGLLGIENSQDYMVAFLAVTTLFLIPDGKGERLLDWDSAVRIPWGMLILFGAGIAIAAAFTESGLSQTIGAALSGLATLPVPLPGGGTVPLGEVATLELGLGPAQISRRTAPSARPTC